jgi:hypothetical protein
MMRVIPGDKWCDISQKFGCFAIPYSPNYRYGKKPDPGISGMQSCENQDVGLCLNSEGVYRGPGKFWRGASLVKGEMLHFTISFAFEAIEKRCAHVSTRRIKILQSLA